jgi:ATP-dependent Lhr-like helicase
MKQSFRAVATIAGLIERNLPGHRKSGRQASFSSDIFYDTLQKYDPDHLLMRVARTEALSGLVDFGRIRAMLDRVEDRIDHLKLPHVSPFAAPLLIEVGRIAIQGDAVERLLDAEASALMHAAGVQI